MKKRVVSANKSTLICYLSDRNLHLFHLKLKKLPEIVFGEQKKTFVSSKYLVTLGGMKRKFLISILIFVFFLSATGFPVVIHTCESSGVSTLFGCEMCDDAVEVSEPESCCDQNTDEKKSDFNQFETIKSLEGESCCFEKVDFHQISYDVSIFNLSNLFVSEFDAVTVSSDLTGEQEITQILRNTDDLPPPSFGKSLLTSIHQLKIALPLS